MAIGIAILGLNGSGKSTLAHALAKETGYYEIDVEDYYFPEQRASRKWALNHDCTIQTEHLGDIPFSKPRTKEEVKETILKEIKEHSSFLLSGVTIPYLIAPESQRAEHVNAGTNARVGFDRVNEIYSYIDIVFLVETPLAVRLKRIQTREKKRFGKRVLPGGDMYLQQIEFQKLVANRDPQSVKENAEKLGCPVILLDGTLPVISNVKKMIYHLDRMLPET